MEEGFFCRPIAHIETDFPEKFGIPRQSGRVEEAMGRVVFLPAYRNPDALRGIEGFTHLWLIFDFSQAHREGFTPTVRPPRLGGNRHVGVFASRSPYRPNPIGLSSVRLVRVEEDGSLLCAGVDLLDGTPILDIKPYLPFSDSHPDATAGYAAEGEGHALRVLLAEGVALPCGRRGELIRACLREDPRPSYQDDPTRIYTMAIAGVEVAFTVAGDTLTVTSVNEK